MREKEDYERTLQSVFKSEFITFHALLIAASIFLSQEGKLWNEEKMGSNKRRRCSVGEV